MSCLPGATRHFSSSTGCLSCKGLGSSVRGACESRDSHRSILAHRARQCLPVTGVAGAASLPQIADHPWLYDQPVPRARPGQPILDPLPLVIARSARSGHPYPAQAAALCTQYLEDRPNTPSSMDDMPWPSPAFLPECCPAFMTLFSPRRLPARPRLSALSIPLRLVDGRNARLVGKCDHAYHGKTAVR